MKPALPLFHAAPRRLLCMLALAAAPWFGGAAHGAEAARPDRPVPRQSPVSARQLAGTYLNEDSSLVLGRNGKFTLTSDICFPEDGEGAGSLHLSGRYRIAQDWIELSYPAGVGARGIPECNAFRRIYMLRAGASLYLFGEEELARITNFLHSEREDFHYLPLHRAGQPEVLSIPGRKWLPEPYWGSLKHAPITGRISRVGPVRSREISNAPNAPSVEAYADVRIDIGEDDGVFHGMRLCSPRARFQTVGRADKTGAALTWVWPANGGEPPQVGTPVTSVCPMR